MRPVPTRSEDEPSRAGRPAPPAGRGLGRAGLALLAVFALCYLAFGVHVSWRRLSDGPGDFGVFYQAGRALLEGRSPYTVTGFLYPPPGAFLFAPFAALPFRTARLAWFVVGQLALLAAAAGTWRWLGGGGAALLAVGAVWGLGGPVVEENLFLGQLQPLLLALIAFALWQLDRRPRTAGALIGLTAALKVWPAGLLLPLIARRRRRAAVAALAVGAATVAVPLLALAAFRPPPLRPADGLFLAGSPAPLNLSLPAVALRVTDPPRSESLPVLPLAWRQGSHPARLRLPPSRRALAVAVALAVLVLGGTAMARTLRALPPGRGDGHVLAATVSILLVASPISWFHYQLLQFPGLALLGRSALRRRSAAAMLGLAGLLLGLTWTRWLGAWWSAWFGMPMASKPVPLWLFTTATPVLSLVLAGWLLREARRDTATAG